MYNQGKTPQVYDWYVYIKDHIVVEDKWRCSRMRYGKMESRVVSWNLKLVCPQLLSSLAWKDLTICDTFQKPKQYVVCDIRWKIGREFLNEVFIIASDSRHVQCSLSPDGYLSKYPHISPLPGDSCSHCYTNKRCSIFYIFQGFQKS